ncbi:MAG: metallophosphoesterase family protein [Flavobacteriaceae bacterium]|nr:metallophosphoesterase family protein [Flavobacteriaceae bacterium]MDG2504159.1 metallophosphoesterase family protein [Flavobacteriaceae bacterium]
MKKILLLSDTHGHLDSKIKNYVKQADEVWHAGDIGKLSILDELEALKPLRAVYGNIDGNKVRLQAPEVLSFSSEGVVVLITHIAGYPGRYTPQARSLITQYRPKLFICGHSHILKVMQDKTKGHLHMNPGAAGISGFHKIRTMLRFELSEGKIQNLEAIELGLRGTLSNAVYGAD